MEIYVLILVLCSGGVFAGGFDPRCSKGTGGDCICAIQPCHELRIGYCVCPEDPDGDGCQPAHCCCNQPVEQCNDFREPVCSVLEEGNCHANGKKHCDPPVCGDLTHPYRCCCEENDDVISYHDSCRDGRGCECMEATCYSQKLAYCECHANRKCDERNCCCKLGVIETCGRDNCKCARERPCHELGMAYCDPEVCGRDCPPERCCCDKIGHDSCRRACECMEATCYSQKLAYCECPANRKCDERNCCCKLGIIETCGRDNCKCARERPCHELGMAYCDPEVCGRDCPPERCCCDKIGHDSCRDGRVCECTEATCSSQGLTYCDCPANMRCGERNCCCTLAQVPTCGGTCWCAQEKPCHELGLRHCEPEECGRGCSPERCCCNSRVQPLPAGVISLTNDSSCEDNCNCQERKCYDLKKEYCRCNNCPAERCCCDTAVETCAASDGCECKRGRRSCHERGLKYCPPGSCEGNCPAAKCCCRELTSGVTVTKTFGCEDESSCHCYKTNCYLRGAEYCRCSNCDDPYCCCDTKVKRCSGTDCECKKRGKKSCHQRGLAYCRPGSCGEDCPGAKCCCSEDADCPQDDKDECMRSCLLEGQVAIPGTECTDCSCQDVCHEHKCPPGFTCVSKQVSCASEFEPCPPEPICDCSEEEKARCMRHCLEERLVALAGTECSGCRCMDPCAAVTCIEGEHCVATPAPCQLEAPCPLVGRCVPMCSGGRVFEPCYDGCPHNPPCGERLRPCAADHDRCEHKCVCPAHKPYVNDDDQCVTAYDCADAFHCTGGRVFEPCFNGCPHTHLCGEQHHPCDPVIDLCVPTCVCPAGKLFINQNDECVTRDDCATCPNGRPGRRCGQRSDCPRGSYCYIRPENIPSVCCPLEVQEPFPDRRQTRPVNPE